MSYPTQSNTKWERHPQAKLLPPRQQAINRPGENEAGEPVEDELPQFEPLEYWHQVRHRVYFAVHALVLVFTHAGSRMPHGEQRT